MIRRIVFALLVLAPLVSQAQLKPGIPAEGKDFITLSAPQPTWGVGGIEVAEVFSYSCVHCAEFQPLVNAWKKKLPAGVRFASVPAAFGGVWDNAGKAFLAAEALGVQAKTHDAVFNAVFLQHKMKTGSIEDFADIYAGLGVDRAKILAVMNSTTVAAKLNRARQFSLRTGVNSTPTLIINGKYRVIGGAGGQQGYLTTADYLIQKELAAAKLK